MFYWDQSFQPQAVWVDTVNIFKYFAHSLQMTSSNSSGIVLTQATIT